jgi:hypothetical protein
LAKGKARRRTVPLACEAFRLLFCFLRSQRFLLCRPVAAVVAVQRLIQLMENEIYATDTH